MKFWYAVFTAMLIVYKHNNLLTPQVKKTRNYLAEQIRKMCFA